MKTIIIVIVVLFVLYLIKQYKKPRQESSIEKFQVSLTDNEKKLLDTLTIEHNIGLAIKELTNKPISELYLRYMVDDKPPEIRGIKSVFDKETRIQAILQLRQALDEKKYQVFSCGNYADDKDYYLSIIKTADRYDILRVQETNGINYNIDTPQIIEFLKTWEKKADFFILDAEHDRVIIQFKNLNFDLDKFCDESIKLCPDFLNAFNSTTDLKKYIQKQKVVDFWWD